MDWLFSIAGGVLIGAASALLLLFNGRIAGISGIVGGVLSPARGEVLWRAMFVAGLVGAGVLFLQVAPEALPTAREDFGGRSLAMLVAAGLMVGFGTRLGSGCTSGHGVCGIGRLSPRSLVATGSFMLTGLLSVLVARLVMGGAA